MAWSEFPRTDGSTRWSCAIHCKEQAGNRETKPAIISRSRRLVFPPGFVWPKRAAHRRPHAEEHRSRTRAQASTAQVRCDASRSMRIPHRGGLHPSRRAHVAFHPAEASSTRAPQDEDERRVRRQLTMSNSPSRSRGAFLRPDFATLLHSPRTEGWAERRETFGCSAKHPWGVPSCIKDARERAYDAARQAPCEAPCVP